MILFLISATVTVFFLSAAVILMVSRDEGVDARLMEVAARRPVDPSLTDASKRGVAGIAASLTSLLKPIRSLISGTDEDMAYRLTLAGFRKAEHLEVYTAVKMLLPVVGIVIGTFFGSNMIAAILVGAVAGFFGPDLVLTRLISARQESVSRGLPEALDLLVICME